MVKQGTEWHGIERYAASHYDEDGCELDAHGNAKAPDAADDAFEKLLVYAVPNNKIDLESSY